MKIGYARVSTDDQSLTLQLDALQEAGCEKIYKDKVSGAKAQRPGLQDALDYIREGDTLVVWRLDRLGRSLKHLIETIQLLEEQGIGFQSLQEAVDTNTTGGKLVFNIFGALAEFERNLIREPTKAGLKAARAVLQKFIERIILFTSSSIKEVETWIIRSKDATSGQKLS